MARPFRLFSIYEFFSVFIPGLATAFGLALLLPMDIDVSLAVALLPLLVLSFVFGQALHSAAAFIEAGLARLKLVNSHREAFASELNYPEKVGPQVVRQFKEELAIALRDEDLMNDSVMEEDDWSEIYTFVQSYIYSHEVGRSRIFQAIFAFSRSMTVLLSGLPILYVFHQIVRSQTSIIDREPNYLRFFDNYREFIEAFVPLSVLGAILFLYGAYSYKNYFAQYLIADFVAIRQQDR